MPSGSPTAPNSPLAARRAAADRARHQAGSDRRRRAARRRGRASGHRARTAVVMPRRAGRSRASAGRPARSARARTRSTSGGVSGRRVVTVYGPSSGRQARRTTTRTTRSWCSWDRCRRRSSRARFACSPWTESRPRPPRPARSRCRSADGRCASGCAGFRPGSRTSRSWRSFSGMATNDAGDLSRGPVRHPGAASAAAATGSTSTARGIRSAPTARPSPAPRRGGATRSRRGSRPASGISGGGLERPAGWPGGDGESRRLDARLGRWRSRGSARRRRPRANGERRWTSRAASFGSACGSSDTGRHGAASSATATSASRSPRCASAGDSVVLEMADYAAAITARLAGDSLTGAYRNVGNRGPAGDSLPGVARPVGQ